MTTPQYITGNIRDLLTHGFEDQELRRLCYDEPLFRPVHDRLAESAGKAAIIDELIEYAETQLLLDLLLKLAEKLNPARYRLHGPYYRLEGVAAQARLDVALHDAPGTIQKPARLFGRKELCYAVHGFLDEGRQVLLYGLGGAGKTALAATVAHERIAAGKGPVLWLQPGREEAPVVFEALVQELGTDDDRREFSRLAGDAGIRTVGRVLARSGARLIVLDNVWNGHALFSLRETLPDGMRLLVTSRFKFGLDELVEVADLSDEAALELLAHHAGRPGLKADPEARSLCEELGGHAYAVEIAGTILKVDQRTPRELQRQIEEAPHDVSMPLDLAAKGRESVKKLLDSSVSALDDEFKALLRCFGTLFAPGASAALLAACQGRPKAAVEKGLTELVWRSLARRVQGDGHYLLHDLTFSYAQALVKDPDTAHRGVVAAVQRYVALHTDEFDQLAFDQNNILAAARLALSEDPDALVSIMTVLATGGYLDARGHTPEFVQLLDETIGVVRAMPAETERLHYLLSKRGNIYFNRGEMEAAFQTFRAALDLAPNPFRRVVLLAVMGKVRSEQGQTAEAEACFGRGSALAEAGGDDRALDFLLEQQCYAAGRRGDAAAAHGCAARAVEVRRRRVPPDPRGLARSLVNLGSAGFLAAAQQALADYREAYHLAENNEDRVLMAHALCGMGYVYHVLERGKHYERARESFDRARRLWQDLGLTAEERELTAFMVRFGYLTSE